jgi:hypothetical protein
LLGRHRSFTHERKYCYPTEEFHHALWFHTYLLNSAAPKSPTTWNLPYRHTLFRKNPYFFEKFENGLMCG